MVKKENYHNSERGGSNNRRLPREFEMSAEILRDGENTSMIRKNE